MKIIGLLFSVLLVLFLNPIKSVLAHNGVDEATSTVIGYIFFKWARKEKAEEVDALPSKFTAEGVNQ